MAMSDIQFRETNLTTKLGSLALSFVCYTSILAAVFAMPTKKLDNLNTDTVVSYMDLGENIKKITSHLQDDAADMKKKNVNKEQSTNSKFKEYASLKIHKISFAPPNITVKTNEVQPNLTNNNDNFGLSVKSVSNEIIENKQTIDVPNALQLSQSNESRAENKEALNQEIDNYIEHVLKQIERNKNYPQSAIESGKCGIAIVKIEIHANGQLSHLTLIHSSGSKLLDNAALDAVKASAPFKEPPLKNGAKSLTLETPIKFEL